MKEEKPVDESNADSETPIVISPVDGETATDCFRYNLKFQYACRKNIAFDSCQGKILWNGREVYEVVPTDHKVHGVHLIVSSKHGENSLQVQGTGKSDSYGLTLDNFELVKEGTTEDICINGGFEKPDVKGKWGLFNGITGW